MDDRWSERDRYDRDYNREYWRQGQQGYGGTSGAGGYAQGSGEYGYNPEDRGFLQRAGDEVRSWFGDEEAQRRRNLDQQYDEPRGAFGAWGGSYAGSSWGSESGAWPRGSESWSRSQESGSWGDRMTQGPHFGKGPRNYQRADSRIQDDVCDRLSEDGAVDASDIEVKVQNGEVTLSGSVDSRFAKRHAEDLAEDVFGVQHVSNELRVSQSSPGGSTSASTAGSGSASQSSARSGSQKIA